jgi:hypothetical protein
MVRSPIFFPFLEYRLFTRVGLIDTVLKIGFEYARAIASFFYHLLNQAFFKYPLFILKP